MAKGSVLIADDDSAIRIVLNQAVTRAGYDVRITSNISTLWGWILEGEGDCVISDVIMPDGDAFELLPRIKKQRPELPVILISAQNTFMTALKAQEAGAFEYLPKPFDLQMLIDAVERSVFEPKDNLPVKKSESYGEDMPLVGRSSHMQEIYRSIARLRDSDLNVMFSGETGTGKHLMAKVLHDFGGRKHNPFISVNLAAIPAESIERELFGEVSDTGKISYGALRAADGGTLYLDEVSLLSDVSQVRLLRVLMEGQATPIDGTDPVRANVRIVSSTTRDMDHLIKQGAFREDLFYRLSIVPIHIPPLRNRVDDIADLARHFVKKSQQDGAHARHIDAGAIKLLKEQIWYGNVRELENLIRRICVLYPNETITSNFVETEIRNSRYFRKGVENASNGGFSGLKSATEYFVDRYFDEYSGTMPPKGVYQRFLEEFEYPLIKATLAATNGNQIKASLILGLNRNTLRKKIQDLGISIVKTAK